MAMWRRVEQWLCWLPWHRRDARDADLERELRDHLELEAAEQQDAGLSPQEAACAAHRALGNTLKIEEDVRAAWEFQWFETFAQDVRYALRMLRKSPGFTVVAVLTLALGIGATAAVFCLVRGVFWRALPYRDASRLVFLTEGTKSIADLSVSYPDFLDWEKQVHAFDGIAAFQDTNFDFDSNGSPERISARNVSSNFFPLLGVTPALGRDFVSADDQPGAPAVLLSGYSFWQTHLGASRNAVGTTIRLNGHAFTLIGVLPRSFVFETPTDVYVPIGQSLNTFLIRNRAKHPFIYGLARLKPSVTLAEAQTELQTVSRRLQQQYPASNAGVYALAKPLQDELANGAQAPLRALAIAVALLLLIGFANVANLLLARASQREAEFAVRTALGARRFRIVRQLLTESALMGLLGAAAGLILAGACLGSLRVLIPATLRSMVEFRVNAVVVVFALAISLSVSAIFGLLSLFSTLRTNLNESLKNCGRSGGAESAHHRLRSALVVSEIACAFVALTSAGLVLRSFRLASEVKPGFELSNLLTMRIELSQSNYSTDAQVTAFFQQTLSKLRAVPGVVGAAGAFPLPFTSHGYPYDFYVDGRPIPPSSQLSSSNFHFVTPEYFDVMGIPLLRGRDFLPSDDEKSPPVAIISENFAADYWPHSDAIGKRIHLDPAEGGGSVTVIGIVGDTKESGPDTPTTTEFYLPSTQRPIPFMAFVLRTRVAPLSLSSAAVNTVHSIDSVDPLYDIRTMNEYGADVLAKRRTNAFLFCAVGLLIILLAAIGVYAVISYGIAQRTHEIGVRMALGARRRDVLRLVVGDGAKLAFAGIVVGVLGALTLTRLMISLLFEVKPTDPATFATVAILLSVVALGACYIPARRAMKVDPMVALRHE